MKSVIVLMAVLLAGTLQAQTPAQLDLSKARVIADRGEWGSAVPIPQCVDGKPDTSWTSGAMDLRLSPANILIILDRPCTLAALELDTVVLKAALRVTAFEVYGRVGTGWALLGKHSDPKRTTQRVLLKPLATRQLRLRIRNNAREGHGWAVVNELRAYTAPAVGDAPVASAVRDESIGERMFVAAALDELPKYPKAVFDPEKGYLHYVRHFADTMLRCGTDQYGAIQSPMFASLLLLPDAKHPQGVIPSMPGQRIGDRAFFGGNLQHDLPLLMAMQALSALTQDQRYAEQATSYLRFFLTNCTATPTGLWPWGEHGHWDFFAERTGSPIHEYLGAPPQAFLEAAWAISPRAVIGEADGIINHIRDFETYQFCRHADIEKPLVDPRQADRKGLDFPRHGAMFLRHWAFTYSKTRDPKYLQHIEGMLKHFELTRLKDGFLPILSQYSDRPALAPNGGCNLSVGVSLLEAAPLLDGTSAGDHAKKLGTELLATLAVAPAKAPQKALFGMVYGGSEFTGGDAALRVQAYRLTKDPRHLDAARAFAEVYAPVAQMPAEGNVRAQVYGVLVDLFLDLHELDKDPRWLAAAENYARFGIEDLYHEGLFRGASNLTYYDSELYVSTFVYSLVRLQSRLDSGIANVPSLYFHR